MKELVVIIMLVALFLLYRIAYPKRSSPKNGDNTPFARDTDISEVVVRSRFVRPEAGQPAPTPATPEKDDNQEKNRYIFAPGNESRNPVIPPEKFDEIFGEEINGEALDEINPDELDIEPDEDENSGEAVNLDDEADEFEQGTEIASGMSIEEMTEAAHAIDNPTDEKAEILVRVENTDMFEQLVSGDDGKAARIKSIIDRHFRSLPTEVDNSDSSETGEPDDMQNFDIRNYLSRNIKK